jgi:hypothetical protein
MYLVGLNSLQIYSSVFDSTCVVGFVLCQTVLDVNIDKILPNLFSLYSCKLTCAITFINSLENKNAVPDVIRTFYLANINAQPDFGSCLHPQLTGQLGTKCNQ